MCYCGGEKWVTVESQCKACSKQLMFPKDQKDHEMAFELISYIFSDISKLESHDFWFDECNGESKTNGAAYLVAQLGR